MKDEIKLGSGETPLFDTPSEIRLRRKSIAILKNLKLAGQTKQQVLEMRKFGRASIDAVFG